MPTFYMFSFLAAILVVPLAVGVGVLYFDKEYRSWEKIKQEFLAEPADFIFICWQYGRSFSLYFFAGVVTVGFCLFILVFALLEGVRTVIDKLF